MKNKELFIVGLGGTPRPGSSSEKAMAMAMRTAKKLGAEVQLFGGADLILPMYDPGPNALNDRAKGLIDALRAADGLILSSPCYHGGISGLLKNAIDYTEEMRNDARVYLDGRAVGVIGVGAGYQGPGTVVQQLRNITHALRGWNTPLGVAVNSAVVKFHDDSCSDDSVAKQIELMASQVVSFAKWGALGNLEAARYKTSLRNRSCV
jgi:FMN reductase